MKFCVRIPEENEPVRASLPVSLSSYRSWRSQLTKLVLRTRTAFSAFLHFSIRISKSDCQRGRLAPAFSQSQCLQQVSSIGCPHLLLARSAHPFSFKELFMLL